ncbi:hypothetical protein H072_5965 [Dactylellina haptotyla CBS 200.50]|uniref:Major facilitator superfamily (MFS) profile domain-containing protein n=1 Tax=Dactylellina haptotyla (strain CBS 200.50) TaxID=1284197 RepID=S8ABD2_DACHA|nr:hypothetical protein H072_5965 [Dactylellina haptotyla CBS 200.50]
MALSSIFPYLPSMLRGFRVPEADIGSWAGIISASIAVAQFLTAVAWGRLSDRIGRKPSLLVGLFITMTGVLLFGFSTSIPMAIIARLCVGVPANVVILRTVVAELVPDPDMRVEALSFLPLAWNIGLISGVTLGGILSEPAQKYPSIFVKDGFFDRNPWALPNILIAAMALAGAVLTVLFLDETLADHKDRYDPGRELGEKLESFFKSSRSNTKSRKSARARLYLDTMVSDEETIRVVSNTPPSWSQILTPQSVCTVILFSISIMHRVTAEQLISLFFATHLRAKLDPIRLPFHIPGGFGMNSFQIGLIFAMCGITEIPIQLFVYAPLVRRYGNRKLLMVTAMVDPVLYFGIPYLLALYTPPSADGGGGSNNLICYSFWCLLLFVISLNTVLGLNSCLVLVTNSASSVRALATLNGFAQSLASVGVGFGPGLFGSLYSVGQKGEWTTIPWVGLTVVAAAMWIWIPQVEERVSFKETIVGDTADIRDIGCRTEDRCGSTPQLVAQS